MVSLGYLVGVVPVVIGLFLFGLGMGAWDVGMNVQGALAERRLGRAIMPRFHAGFSVGTVAGALIGAGMVALQVPVPAHLLGVAVLVGVGVPLAVRGFLPDDVEQDKAADRAGPGRRGAPLKALHAWREPRTLLIGLFVLAFAFAEGTGNDWIGIALIDGYGTSAAVGTLGFATFLAAMTAGRWFGPRSLDRYGRVIVIRGADRDLSGGCVVICFWDLCRGRIHWRRALGRWPRLGFPGRDECRRGRGSDGGTPGQRDRLDRILRVLSRAAVDWLRGRPLHRAPRGPRRRRAPRDGHHDHRRDPATRRHIGQPCARPHRPLATLDWEAERVCPCVPPSWPKAPRRCNTHASHAMLGPSQITAMPSQREGQGSSRLRRGAVRELESGSQ